MPVNYGCLPQTLLPRTQLFGGLPGDGDALDVCDVSRRRATGEHYMLIPLALLPVIDQGEWDAKVIGVAADDPVVHTPGLFAPDGFSRVFPGLLGRLREWFASYKTREDPRMPVNVVLAPVLGTDAVANAILEAHSAWQREPFQ
jgi:inorganic pyrophosphatase